MANRMSNNKLKLRNKILRLTNSVELYEMTLQIKQESAIQKFTKRLYKQFDKYSQEVGGNAEYIQSQRGVTLARYDAKQYWQRKAITHNLTKELTKLELGESTTTKEQLEADCNSQLAILEAKRKGFIAQLDKKFDKKIMQGNMPAEEATKSIDELSNSYQKEIDNYTEGLTKLNADKFKEFSDRVNAKKEVLQASLQALLSEQDKMSQEDIISLEGLCMYFGGLKAADDLSFSIKKGEIFGLIGPNGAGKTTVFNCITQFYNPTAGKVYYRNGNDEVMLLNGEKPHDIINYGIVRTFQNVELVWELTVLDNLLVASHSNYNTGLFGQMINSGTLRREEKLHKAKALEVLEYMGLSEFAYRIPYGLPYGVLKRIELARTLMCQPQLIILDEPAAGLNDQETEELAQLIVKIRDERNVTIFLVEHDMGLVMSICDRICAISFGKLLAVGTPQEIQQHKGVQEAYLGAGEDGDE